ncbi:hypothetical protein O1Q76_24300, partial [Vibrio alginolyticus]|nr:hypothetical protein [Vibrio alginolyticus]
MTAIYTAFFTYVIITSITPGPNNILSLSIATQYGLKRSVNYHLLKKVALYEPPKRGPLFRPAP